MLLTFGPGVLSLDVSVPIVDDDLVEVDEIFYGNLRLPENSTQERVAFGPARANGTITNDDGMYNRKANKCVTNNYIFAEAVIGFVRDYEVVEGVNLTVAVRIALLQGMLGRDIVVNVYTGNDSALCKGDTVQCRDLDIASFIKQRLETS